MGKGKKNKTNYRPFVPEDPVNSSQSHSRQTNRTNESVGSSSAENSVCRGEYQTPSSNVRIQRSDTNIPDSNCGPTAITTNKFKKHTCTKCGNIDELKQETFNKDLEREILRLIAERDSLKAQVAQLSGIIVPTGTSHLSVNAATFQMPPEMPPAKDQEVTHMDVDETVDIGNNACNTQNESVTGANCNEKEACDKPTSNEASVHADVNRDETFGSKNNACGGSEQSISRKANSKHNGPSFKANSTLNTCEKTKDKRRGDQPSNEKDNQRERAMNSKGAKPKANDIDTLPWDDDEDTLPWDNDDKKGTLPWDDDDKKYDNIPKRKQDTSRWDDDKKYDNIQKRKQEDTSRWDDDDKKYDNIQKRKQDTSRWDDDDKKYDNIQKRKQSPERSGNRSRESSYSEKTSLKDKDYQERSLKTWGRGNGQGALKSQHSKAPCQTGVVNEIFDDLFNASKEVSLAHCVAEDMRMGSGIATTFKQVFKNVDTLLAQRKKTGEVAVLKDEDRYIYYLVTKKISTGKPTYCDLESSLQNMKVHCVENGVTAIAMPRIGCGLDRLEWRQVRRMLEDIFVDTQIKITVYNYQQNNEESASAAPRSKLFVVTKPMSLITISKDTAIIFFGSEDGGSNKTIDSLEKRFHFFEEYCRIPKSVGDVVKFERGDYVYGLIVRKNSKNPFSYENFSTCLHKLRNMISKDGYEYMGLEAFTDSDDLIMEKIITLLKWVPFRNELEVWVCYPPDVPQYSKTLQ